MGHDVRCDLGERVATVDVDDAETARQRLFTDAFHEERVTLDPVRLGASDRASDSAHTTRFRTVSDDSRPRPVIADRRAGKARAS